MAWEIYSNVIYDVQVHTLLMICPYPLEIDYACPLGVLWVFLGVTDFSFWVIGGMVTLNDLYDKVQTYGPHHDKNCVVVCHFLLAYGQAPFLDPIYLDLLDPHPPCACFYSPCDHHFHVGPRDLASFVV